MTMEKKAYIKPAVEVLMMETIEMIAQSAPQIEIIKPGTGGDDRGEEILSTGRRGSWGNLWD